MTTFDDRSKGFEAQFAHNEEFEFKAVARRNRMIGLWAGEKKNVPVRRQSRKLRQGCGAR